MMWSNLLSRPDVGRKIVAVYADGSGANIFYVSNGGYIDSDGDEYGDIAELQYYDWAYLPDGFKFWCESRTDNPVALSMAERT